MSILTCSKCGSAMERRLRTSNDIVWSCPQHIVDARKHYNKLDLYPSREQVQAAIDSGCLERTPGMPADAFSDIPAHDYIVDDFNEFEVKHYLSNPGCNTDINGELEVHPDYSLMKGERA